MKIKSKIPNILTILRIVITLFLCITYWQMPKVKDTYFLVTICVLTSLIYISDILDGYLARRWQACSRAGEQLDIFADIFYIGSQGFILCNNRFMPQIVLICIVLEFAVFVVTSFYTVKGQQERLFFFEIIGRWMAVYYYLLPLLYILTTYCLNLLWIRSVLMVICLIGTIIAISNRIYLTIRYQKLIVIS